MAGDWIKMRCDLRSHPKVVTLSSRIQRDIFATIGGLHSVWCVFDAHSDDGTLHGYTLEMMDSIAGFPGLSAGMVSVGWLVQDGEKLTCPRFDSHNSKSAKKRCETTERKRRERKAQDCHANVTQMSRKECDKSVTREEKRREENINPTLSTPQQPSSNPQQPSSNPQQQQSNLDQQPAFLPPTFEEIELFAVNAGAKPGMVQEFYDYYCENGWKSSRGPMADWKAAFRRWMRNEKENPRPTNRHQKGSAENDRFTSSIGALERFAARHSAGSSEGPGSPVCIKKDI